jgi:excisionase family DNA binding protein
MLTAPYTTSPVGTDLDPWLTLQQAADERQCHEATLRRLIKAGLLRHARIGLGRKHIRIRRSWLDQAMEACATPVEAR